jgi:hypothetical protein
MGQLEIAQLLLKHGAEINSWMHLQDHGWRYWPNKRWCYGPSALYTAVLNGNEQLVGLFLNDKYLCITLAWSTKRQSMPQRGAGMKT